MSVRECSSGCGCRYGTDDPDRRDCACDGECTSIPDEEWYGVPPGRRLSRDQAVVVQLMYGLFFAAFLGYVMPFIVKPHIQDVSYYVAVMCGSALFAVKTRLLDRENP